MIHFIDDDLIWVWVVHDRIERNEEEGDQSWNVFYLFPSFDNMYLFFFFLQHHFCFFCRRKLLLNNEQLMVIFSEMDEHLFPLQTQ